MKTYSQEEVARWVETRDKIDVLLRNAVKTYMLTPRNIEGTEYRTCQDLKVEIGEALLEMIGGTHEGIRQFTGRVFVEWMNFINPPTRGAA